MHTATVTKILMALNNFFKGTSRVNDTATLRRIADLHGFNLSEKYRKGGGGIPKRVAFAIDYSGRYEDRSC